MHNFVYNKSAQNPVGLATSATQISVKISFVKFREMRRVREIHSDRRIEGGVLETVIRLFPVLISEHSMRTE